jgi:hypothetical protein
MTEQHVHDDALVALALDDADEEQRTRTLRHLDSCPRCRTEYDDFAATVESTLAAVPAVEPEPGFDSRVLAAMGMAGADASPASSDPSVHELHPDRRRTGRSRRRRWALVAASAAAGLAVGVGGSYGYLHAGSEAGSSGSVLTAGSAFLATPSGEHVGTVTRSYIKGDPVLLVTVDHGKPGMTYLCLLRLSDGEQIPTDDWTLGEELPVTWVVPAPERPVSEVVMVANGGAGPVWSTARL